MPSRAASRRVVQWVSGFGGGCWVSARIFASKAGVMRSPRPLRGASCNPWRRWVSKRFRQRVSVVLLSSSRAPNTAYGSPSASARITRARCTNPAAKVRDRVIVSSSVRSSIESSSGYGEVNMHEDTTPSVSTQL